MRGRGLWWLICAWVVLGLGGCLELTGQRLTIRHDAANDRLLLLICHDGIHEDADGKNPPGKRRMAEYLRDGDVMFVDWFGNIERKKAREAAKEQPGHPALRAFAGAYLDSVRSYAIGHYRDVDGRIGAAQLVVVSGARAFVRKANAAIDEALVELAESEQPRGLRADVPRTFAKLLARARAGGTWIGLSGHALTLTFPVDRAEWSLVKAGGIRDFLEDFEPSDDPGELRPEALLQFVASSAFSFAARGDLVTFTLGGERQPETLRLSLREDYRQDLEAAVTELVPQSFDDLVAAATLRGREAGPDAPRELALSCVPPEDRVRAVLRAGRQGNPAADRWLRGFAADWNRDVGLPPAPTTGLDPDAWAVWYRRVLRFPAGGE